MSRPYEYVDPRAPEFLRSGEWRRVRMAALKKYGARCQCCGAEPSNARLNVDHVLPRETHPERALDIENLQVLCDECNHGKGNWDTTDWRKQKQPPNFDGDWPALVCHLNLNGMAGMAARNAAMVSFEYGHLQLVVPEVMRMYATPEYIEKLRAALVPIFGGGVRVSILAPFILNLALTRHGDWVASQRSIET